MHLEIPVTEGDQYRVGEVKFEGLTVFKAESVRPIFKLQTGDVYNESRLKKGYREAARRLRRAGLLPVDGCGTERKPDPRAQGRRRHLNMEEDKRYFVGRSTSPATTPRATR